ncbi:MAG: tRNA uridine-5-carboxymethylaminomethyl(34) synthesis GTPase MnmE [Ruminococcaceae bacterium]|nr:tRNA uridine-5-carboxymethylaminomethyl(34) synthesis GTPase MnmE [Oscillospiraceae bacterium]
MNENKKVIAAIATAQAAGGVGMIRVSGDNAMEICDKVFTAVSGNKLENSKGYRAYFGRVRDADGDIDDCVALVFRAPHSYTGENVVELSCHGGLYVLKRTLRAVLEAGASPARAGEFTERAFLNGKMDLTQAEAVMDLIGAQGKQAADAALTALDGTLSRKIDENTQKLVNICAHLSAWVDYPDEEIEELETSDMLSSMNEVENSLENLIATYDNGKVLTQGVKTAIVGRPNVGKSTLMNMLVGSRKSIVTSYAGTTRDVVEETVILGGISLHLSDTAGIRESDDPIEAIGVDIAKDRLKKSEFVIAVFDGSEELTKEDNDVLEFCKDKLCLGVINKTDLDTKNVKEQIAEYIETVVEISAEKLDGKDNLEKAVQKLLETDRIDTTSAMLTAERQYLSTVEALSCVKEAKDALQMGLTLDAVNVSLDCAIEKLLELTGKKASETVVNEIFSQFCVGK